MSCKECPPGVSCYANLETDVVIATATTLGFDGGAAEMDKDSNREAFSSAIVEAMAAGPSGLTVQVTITSITDTARRLGERVGSRHAVGVAFDGALRAMGEALGITSTTDAINEGGLVTEFIENIFNNFDDPSGGSPDLDRRALAVTQVKVEYTILVPVDENTAVGDVNAIKVRSIGGRP